MTNPGESHHPSRMDLKTASQILTQASSVFVSHIQTFLILSVLILTFRSNLDNGSHLLTSFLDSDPSLLQPLLSRLHDDNNHRRHHPSSSSSRRRRPFLHLTRVGTLDDDFFSGPLDINPSSPLSPTNSTSLSLLHSPPFFIRPGLLTFNLLLLNTTATATTTHHQQEEEETSANVQEQGGEQEDMIFDLGFIVKGLELRRRDASALFFLVTLLSAAYGYVIAGFVVTYSWAFGIVFLEVVNHYLGFRRRRRSVLRTLWDGSALGLRRLSGFILMKWAVRDAVTQLLGLWYFGEIEDQYSFFKIFVKLKLMPFSITTTSSSSIRGFEEETAGFMFAWLLVDLVVEFVFVLDSWVAIVDSRKTGREIVKEGCSLLSTMFRPAVTIKCLESILCGSALKWSLARYFGKLFGTAFQSLMEVYFMVTWLILYFAVRSKDATLDGRTFGQRELEGFIQGHR